MNNHIKYFILGLAVLGGLTACNKQLTEEPQALVNTHRVYFSSATTETRTGITIADGTMTPDWRKTQPGNIHLFERGSSGYAEGEDVEITLSEGDKVAHFKADFPTDMTIIVDPSKKTSILTASNEQNDGPYTYAAIVAQATESAYIVPAVQRPDAETLIDPDADFLIGYSRKSYDAAHNWEEDIVDLYFDRPVSLGRINISSFEEGEKVKSVVIKAPGLSGSAAYAAIDFENATVTFTPDEATEGETAALTLDYGAGADLADDGTFGAYFVALPGKALVSEIVVTTDKWVYTKTVDKEITFSKDSFKNLTLNLSTATKEAAAPTEIKWYKASVLEDGIDYIIVSANQALTTDGTDIDAYPVSPDNGIIIFETAPDASMIWHAVAKEIAADKDLIAGHFTLENNSNYLQRIQVSSTDHTYKMGVGGIPETTKYYAWEYDGEHLFHVSNSSATFYCWYDEGWTTDYRNQKGTELYTSRPPIEMSFSEPEKTFDKDGTEPFVAPILTVPDGVTVTYSSSNEAVATVDDDGNVTILKAGTTVITAVAAGNADYQAGSASYTIIVTSSHVPTWYPVEEVQANEEYIIISNGNVLYNNDGSPAGQSVAVSSDGTVQLDAQTTMLWTVTEESAGFTLKNDGKFLQRSYSSSTWSPAIGSKPNTNNWYMWVYTGGNKLFFQGSSDKYYFFYDNGWKISTTESNTHVATLYSLTKQKLPQHLSFTSESVSAVLGEPFTAPALEGVKTTVTWTSSDEGVATVTSDGTVSLVGKGTTTITATAAANDEYNAGSASYTLKVTDGSVSIWYKADEIEDGQSYIVISNGSALKNNSGSLAAETNSLFTGDSFQYEAESELIWLVTGTSSSFTLKNDGKYLRRGSSGLQISSTNSSNTCTYDGSYVKIATSYVLYCNDGSWTTGNSTNDSRKVSFYTSTPPRQAQTLSFSATSVNHDIAGSAAFTAPSLSGAQTTVTYSSSKETVATVDAETGAVEIVGVGTTTITASAEGTTEYKPATASYTIHVTDSSTPTTTKRYVLANSIEAGKDYIIVSGGYALKNDNGSVASVAVEPVDGALEFEPGEEEDLVWLASRETSLPDNGDYTFQNDGKYIRRPSGGGTTLAIQAASSFTKYFVYLYDGTHLYHHNLGGQNSDTPYVYWVYYDSGSWKFAYEATTDPNHSKAKVTQLYVEE